MMLHYIQLNSDIILTVCSLVFGVSLFPTIYNNIINKQCGIPYGTSVPTFLGMLMVTLVYASNSFILSTIVGTVTTIAWLTLSLQRYKYK